MLTNEELQKIIDQFDEEELKRLGIFGISHHGRETDESFIRANKEGLELFALKLLKSARDIDDILSDPEKTIIPLDCQENWIDEYSDTIIQYIEPVSIKQILKPTIQNKSTFGEKIMPYGCGLTALLLIIATIVGLITLVKWLF